MAPVPRNERETSHQTALAGKREGICQNKMAAKQMIKAIFQQSSNHDNLFTNNLRIYMVCSFRFDCNDEDPKEELPRWYLGTILVLFGSITKRTNKQLNVY